MAHTSAEKAAANETHTKPLIEEVDTHAAKINQYENGKLSKAMIIAVNKVVEKTIKTGNATALDNMNTMTAMISNLELVSTPAQQLMLVDEDEDTPIPKAGTQRTMAHT